jgi:hypothetical protein
MMRMRTGSGIINHDRRRFLSTAAMSIAAAAAVIAVVLVVSGGSAMSAQDRYTVKVPNGLAFSEFRGYENWQTVAVSQSEDLIEVILGNPAMINAFRAGAPGNGKPFSNGAKMAKIHWKAKERGGPRSDVSAGHAS